MKNIFALIHILFATLVCSVPFAHVRRDLRDLGHNVAEQVNGEFWPTPTATWSSPTGTAPSWSGSTATGGVWKRGAWPTGTSSAWPTGTAPSSPKATGTAPPKTKSPSLKSFGTKCAPHWESKCSGPSLRGSCTFTDHRWQWVWADLSGGDYCQDGQIYHNGQPKFPAGHKWW